MQNGSYNTITFCSFITRHDSQGNSFCPLWCRGICCIWHISHERTTGIDGTSAWVQHVPGNAQHSQSAHSWSWSRCARFLFRGGAGTSELGPVEASNSLSASHKVFDGRPLLRWMAGGSLPDLMRDSLMLEANCTSFRRFAAAITRWSQWHRYRSQQLTTARFRAQENMRRYHYWLRWSMRYKAINMSIKSTPPCSGCILARWLGKGRWCTHASNFCPIFWHV